MKKYILFGWNTGIGGFQLYCDCRLAYNQSKGYKVYFIDSKNRPSEVKLETLKECNTLNEECCKLFPYYFSKKQIGKFVKQVKEFIGFSKEDEYFIETTNLENSLWGEILAKELNCPNFVYVLASRIPKLTKQSQKFFEFKYKQQLLGGMSVFTLPDIFAGYMDMTDKEKYYIGASWPNPLSKVDTIPDKTDALQQIKNEGYHIIGYYGNLDKPHFRELCLQVNEYAEQHKDSLFLFLSVGSSNANKAEEYQMSHVEACRNMNIAALYPTPEKIFELMDVCIASWGSSTTAARGGALTIRLMDDTNVIPQGVIGVTLKEMPYTQYPVGNDNLPDLLNKILFEGGYSKDEYIRPNDYVDYHIKQNLEDEIIRPFEKRSDLQFYDTTKIQIVKGNPIKRTLYRQVNIVIGEKIARKAKNVFSGIIRKNEQQ